MGEELGQMIKLVENKYATASDRLAAQVHVVYSARARAPMLYTYSYVHMQQNKTTQRWMFAN